MENETEGVITECPGCGKELKATLPINRELLDAGINVDVGAQLLCRDCGYKDVIVINLSKD